MILEETKKIWKENKEVLIKMDTNQKKSIEEMKNMDLLNGVHLMS